MKVKIVSDKVYWYVLLGNKIKDDALTWRKAEKPAKTELDKMMNFHTDKVMHANKHQYQFYIPNDSLWGVFYYLKMRFQDYNR